MDYAAALFFKEYTMLGVLFVVLVKREEKAPLTYVYEMKRARYCDFTALNARKQQNRMFMVVLCWIVLKECELNAGDGCNSLQVSVCMHYFSVSSEA